MSKKFLQKKIFFLTYVNTQLSHRLLEYRKEKKNLPEISILYFPLIDTTVVSCRGNFDNGHSQSKYDSV